MKPRLGQLDQSGAALNEVPMWDGTRWVAASIDEIVRDVIGAALIEGSGITLTVNDAGNSITIASSGGGGGGGATDRARGYLNSATQPIANTTVTVITLDGESFDSGSLHDPAGANPSRITVPTDGEYLVIGSVAHNATAGQLQARILKNGGVVALNAVPSNAAFGVIVPVADVVPAVAGDYFELAAYQSSGAASVINGGSAVTFLSVVGV